MNRSERKANIKTIGTIREKEKGKRASASDFFSYTGVSIPCCHIWKTRIPIRPFSIIVSLFRQSDLRWLRKSSRWLTTGRKKNKLLETAEAQSTAQQVPIFKASSFLDFKWINNNRPNKSGLLLTMTHHVLNKIIFIRYGTTFKILKDC